MYRKDRDQASDPRFTNRTQDGVVKEGYRLNQDWKKIGKMAMFGRSVADIFSKLYQVRLFLD